MKPLVLCSTSPRRKELFGWLGLPFSVRESQFDESCIAPDPDDPEGYVATLALGKVMSVFTGGMSQDGTYPDDALLIGSDTTVFQDGVFYGKPKSIDDARKTLQNLLGAQHSVYTAVAVLDTVTGEKNVEIVQTDVRFFPVGKEDLERYLATGESMGKAGAYAIQEKASKFVQEVRGSFTNVIGFPLLAVRDMLENAGVIIDVDVEQSILRKTGYQS